MLGGLSLEELRGRVARQFGLAIEEIQRRSRDPKRSQARDLFCALAVKYLRYSGVQVGDDLGIGRAAVSHAVRRGEGYLADTPAQLSRLLT